MERAVDIARAGAWAADAAVDVVTLSFDARCRRRLAMVTDGGRSFLLDLARAARLRDGDGLILESGGIIGVRAGPEALVEIRCASPAALTRIAWHLGNRHLPTQLMGDALRIRDDHVMVDMATRLGATVRRVDAPFDPEAGAYDGDGGAHGHGHHHDHA